MATGNIFTMATFPQPDGLVRLVHDNLVLIRAHSALLPMRILYQTSRLRTRRERRLLDEVDLTHVQFHGKLRIPKNSL